MKARDSRGRFVSSNNNMIKTYINIIDTHIRYYEAQHNKKPNFILIPKYMVDELENIYKGKHIFPNMTKTYRGIEVKPIMDDFICCAEVVENEINFIKY